MLLGKVDVEKKFNKSKLLGHELTMYFRKYHHSIQIKKKVLVSQFINDLVPSYPIHKADIGLQNSRETKAVAKDENHR